MFAAKLPTRKFKTYVINPYDEQATEEYEKQV